MVSFGAGAGALSRLGLGISGLESSLGEATLAATVGLLLMPALPMRCVLLAVSLTVDALSERSLLEASLCLFSRLSVSLDSLSLMVAVADTKL